MPRMRADDVGIPFLIPIRGCVIAFESKMDGIRPSIRGVRVCRLEDDLE